MPQYSFESSTATRFSIVAASSRRMRRLASTEAHHVASSLVLLQ
jgi:hypothetical protein